MRNKKPHIILLCLGLVVIALPVSAQNFLDDIKRVSATYAQHPNYVFEWTHYLLDSPAARENYILKKCEDVFYMAGGNQVHCINGSSQVAVDKNENTVLYVDQLLQREMTNPLQLITNLFNSSYTSKLTENVNGLKKYVCSPLENEGGKVELWLDTRLWRVMKVIQYMDADYGHGFVFELNKFSPYCDVGPETNIQTYVKLDANRTPTLTSAYSKYTLYTPDNFNQNR